MTSSVRRPKGRRSRLGRSPLNLPLHDHRHKTSWVRVRLKPIGQTNDKIGRFYRTTKNRPIFVCHTTDIIARFYRPILSAINLAVELGSNFAEKIGRFYRSSVIGFRRLGLNKSVPTDRLIDLLTDGE